MNRTAVSTMSARTVDGTAVIGELFGKFSAIFWIFLLKQYLKIRKPLYNTLKSSNFGIY
jgi:hypothetical protein